MLPTEILSEILIHSDIDDVSNFCRLNKNNICDIQFWIKKFRQDGLLLPSDYNKIQNLNRWIKYYKLSQIYTKIDKNLKSGMKYTLEFNYNELVKFLPEIVTELNNESLFKMILSDEIIVNGYTYGVQTIEIALTMSVSDNIVIMNFIQLFPYKENIIIDDVITIKSKSVLTSIYDTLSYYY